MTPRGHRAARVAAGVGALLLLGGVGALPATADGARAAAGTVVPVAAGAGTVGPTTALPALETSTLPLTVSVTSIDPMLGPGQDLHLTVQVTNEGEGTVTRPRVLVHLDRSQFIGRFSLDDWRQAGDEGPIGRSIRYQDLPAALGPGQTASADVVVPAAAIALPRRLTSWGARGLAVQVVDVADPARARLGLARTFLLWFPDQQVTATRLSVVAPVTGVGVDPLAGTWVSRLEQLTGPGGRLRELVDATADHPEVTWVVDPWLADADSGAGPTARAWAADLRSAATDREVQLLPYLDPDLAALAHAGAGALLRTAITRAEATATALPDSARVSVAWPADPLPDLATAALAERSRQDALLVGPGHLAPPGVLTYTPSGRTTVAVEGDDVTVLVPDERLTTAFRTGVVGPLAGDETVADDGADTDGADTENPDAENPDADDAAAAAARGVTPAMAGQDLLAELAVITRERPSDGRHVLIALSRDWQADAELLDGQLGALASAPWVRLEPVSALIGLADPGVDRGTLPDRAVDPAEVDVTALGTVGDAVERRAHLATIVASPTSLLGDLELEQLAPTSVAWRADPTGRAQTVQASFDVTRALSGAVTVQPPTGQLTLLASSGGIPVQVTNTLDQPVTVSVGLRPFDPRLIADEAVPVTLEPGTEQLVTVPVHAVQSATVRVAVELRTPDGAVLDDSTTFDVNVRAEWETIGTGVLGAILAIGLVVGLVRTVRRGRSRRRARPQSASGPDALSPEEHEHDDAAVGTPTDTTTGTTTDTPTGTAAAPDVHTISPADEADGAPSAAPLVQGSDDTPPAQEATRR